MRSKLDPAIDTSEEQRSLIAKRRKLIISGGFIAVALILLLAISSGKLPGCGSTKPEQQKAIIFNKSGDEVGNLKKVKEEDYGSEEELLKLAQEAKAAGLVVQGVSQCSWTRRQRELFGGSKSKARKVFESMYIECRSRDQCPNVKGYPTWSRGDQMYPGFKNPDRIRELIKEVGQLPPQQQVQDSSLPNESNIPGIKPTVMDAPLPQSIREYCTFSRQGLASLPETVLQYLHPPWRYCDRLGGVLGFRNLYRPLNLLLVKTKVPENGRGGNFAVFDSICNPFSRLKIGLPATPFQLCLRRLQE